MSAEANTVTPRATWFWPQASEKSTDGKRQFGPPPARPSPSLEPEAGTISQ
jgi:hypothetical protein